MIFECLPIGPGLFWSVLWSVILWHQMTHRGWRWSIVGRGVESGSDAGLVCRERAGQWFSVVAACSLNLTAILVNNLLAADCGLKW